MFESNFVTIIGNIAGGFEFDHEFLGEKFYKTYILCERTSGNKDVLPVVVSERICDVKENLCGRRVLANGSIRTYNTHDDLKSQLIIYLFASVFDTSGEIELGSEDVNEVFLDGFICKSPIYRKTPLRRDISDVVLAVNRPYGKSDYIPCIVWGRNAIWIENLPIGSRIKLSGRFQSREYSKKNQDGTTVEKMAYEVSVIRLEECERGEEE